jgi:hypothetical protein
LPLSFVLWYPTLPGSLRLSAATAIRSAIANFRGGKVVCALGDDAAARQAFQEAVQLAVAIHAVPLLLEALVGVATLRLQAGALEQAAEVLGLVLYHPLTPRSIKPEVERTLAAVAGRLSPQLFPETQRRAQRRDLEEVVRAFQTAQSDI